MTKYMRALLTAVVGLAIIMPSTTQADPVPVSACVKQAPAEKSCNNGTHTIVGVEESTVFWVEPAFGNFVGRIRSIVKRANGTVMSDFWCDYKGDDIVADIEGDLVSGSSCDRNAGAFPILEETFTQTCFSYNVGTFTAGGRGVWTCGVTHT